MVMSASGRRDFVISIRPSYADKIVEGLKTVELRRRFPATTAQGAIFLIYSSSPVQAIVGYAVIREVQRLPIRHIWAQFGKAACVTRKDFDEYFDGIDEGYAIVVDRARKFPKQIRASQLRERFGFVPPQSFRYLAGEYYALLDNERIQTPH